MSKSIFKDATLKDLARIASGALLRKLPGPTGQRYQSRYRNGMRPFARWRFRRALADMDPDCINIDLGANMGIYTRAMAARGHQVYAFEPDPWTADQLRQNVGDLPNVTVLQAAAGPEPGQISMYRARNYEENPAAHSVSTSVFADKRNMADSVAFTVEQVDLLDFISQLEAPVGILKIDIEGAEVPLLEALFDHPVRDRIADIFVETHEQMIPELKDRTYALIRRAEKMRTPRVSMYWA